MRLQPYCLLRLQPFCIAIHVLLFVHLLQRLRLWLIAVVCLKGLTFIFSWYSLVESNSFHNLQAKLKSIESQLNEALNASDARSTIGSESASVISTPKMMESTADSSSVTKRLEEELAKRDALIEVLILYVAFFHQSSLCIVCSTSMHVSVRFLFEVYVYEIIKS